MGRPTIVDLAQAAKVSISTVDRVLNGRSPVRQDTSQRVLEAAEAIGFRATSAIRQRLSVEKPGRTFGFLLQQRSTPFYVSLGNALVEAAQACTLVCARPRLEFQQDLTPSAVAAQLQALGEHADAVALVAADHPRITEAIDVLSARGVPVFAIISDLTARAKAGYVGLDSWKVGRSAAWAIAGLAKRPGKVAIFVGSHRYLCQDVCEVAFRSYFRETAPRFELLETLTSLEDERLAFEATLNLLKRHPDLVGLYIAGGGINGVMEALRYQNAFHQLVTVGLDLTGETRSGLIDGVVNLILSHPLRLLAATIVEAMAHGTEKDRETVQSQFLLPFDVYTPENI
jgi:LacI family transcriptional regulator